MDSLVGSFLLLGILCVLVALLPAIIAFWRNHSYRWVILALTIFCWTGIVWVIALAWAIWPSNKSLADPVIGNPTGTGLRNVGDTGREVRQSFEPSLRLPDQSLDRELPTAAMGPQTTPISNTGATYTSQMTDVLVQLERVDALKISGSITEEEHQLLKRKIIS